MNKKITRQLSYVNSLTGNKVVVSTNGKKVSYKTVVLPWFVRLWNKIMFKNEL